MFPKSRGQMTTIGTLPLGMVSMHPLQFSIALIELFRNEVLFVSSCNQKSVQLCHPTLSTFSLRIKNQSTPQVVSFAAIVWARHKMLPPPSGRERCMTSPNNSCKRDYASGQGCIFCSHYSWRGDNRC